MTKALKLALFAGVSAITLSACGGGGGNTPAPPPTGPTALEDNFGAAFGTLFRVSANGDLAEPTAASVIPVSFTTDPVPVP